MRFTTRRAQGCLFVCLCTVVAPSFAQTQYPFQNPRLTIDQRTTNLLSLMTLEEKIDFLGTTLIIPRLGIHASGSVPSPVGTNGQMEGLHGLAVGGPDRWNVKAPGGEGPHGGTTVIATTQFPQVVGMGQTWDPELIERVAAEEAVETRYVFQSYDRGGLIVRAPNADLARDPRWGRFEESYGEDPLLTGTMATAFTRGLQGSDPDHWMTISLLKHFMANSNEDNRQGSSSNFDEALMQEYYAAPFRMAIEQGKAGGVMASYNAVNGIPMTANPLLKSLPKQWGFDGVVDTDRGAVTFMVEDHHYFPDLEHSVAGAMHVGVNQFLNPYEDALRAALKDRLVTTGEIDDNLRGLIRSFIKAGFLDAPEGRKFAEIRAGSSPDPSLTEASKDLALKVTQESIVLLKNSPADHGTALLPLDPTRIRSIAVVGPRASAVYSDAYGGTPPFAITPLAGITERVAGRVDIRFSDQHDQAVELAKHSDLAIVVIGNHPTCGERVTICSDPSEGKEAIDRRRIDPNPAQEKLVEDVFAVNPRTVVVLVSSFPYTIGWINDHVSSIVQMAHSSEQEGRALAGVLFGDVNPAGRLTSTWPASLSQLPAMLDYNLRDGRTYMYAANPLYAFGYGLSYTRFKYSSLRVSKPVIRPGQPIEVAVEVTNTGDRAGDEVVQLYVKHVGSGVPRPHSALAGFRRITLKAKESKTVRFQVSTDSVRYWDSVRHAWAVEADSITLSAGGASDKLPVSQEVSVRP
jgi:beta-glucosidase